MWMLWQMESMNRGEWVTGSFKDRRVMKRFELLLACETAFLVTGGTIRTYYNDQSQPM